MILESKDCALWSYELFQTFWTMPSLTRVTRLHVYCIFTPLQVSVVFQRAIDGSCVNYWIAETSAFACINSSLVFTVIRSHILISLIPLMRHPCLLILQGNVVSVSRITFWMVLLQHCQCVHCIVNRQAKSIVAENRKHLFYTDRDERGVEYAVVGRTFLCQIT